MEILIHTLPGIENPVLEYLNQEVKTQGDISKSKGPRIG